MSDDVVYSDINVKFSFSPRFERKDEVAPVFATEPSVALAPNGGIVLFYTASPWPCRRALCTACNGGSTPPSARAAHGACRPPPGSSDTDPTHMMHARSPYGPWSVPVTVLKGTPGSYVPLRGGEPGAHNLGQRKRGWHAARARNEPASDVVLGVDTAPSPSD